MPGALDANGDMTANYDGTGEGARGTRTHSKALHIWWRQAGPLPGFVRPMS